MVKKKSSVNLALGSATLGKPEGPPPMPEYLSLEPSVVSNRAFALSAMATAPWSPIVAVAGQKQVLLYHTETLRLLGILPFPKVSSSLCPSAEMGKSYSRAGDEEEKADGSQDGISRPASAY